MLVSQLEIRVGGTLPTLMLHLIASGRRSFVVGAVPPLNVLVAEDASATEG